MAWQVNWQKQNGPRNAARLSVRIASERPWSDDLERPHHLVFFVFQDVAVIDVIGRKRRSGRHLEGRDDPRDLPRRRLHGVFPARLLRRRRQRETAVPGPAVASRVL